PGRQKGCKRNGCNSMYLEMSGTSMATGVVSAAVALMLEKSPNLTPDTVKARLMRSARKLDDEPTTVGAGTLNINAALNDTGHVYRTALSPLMIRDEHSDGILVEDTGQLWGHNQWAASVLYAGASSWQQAGSDGTLNIGSSDVSANGFLWTDEGVWARGFLWTDEEVWARGFLWTDEVGARSLVESNGKGAIINDDP
ncbi:MAG: S8 family serine peptidase, partial [Pseudomonadota bacterium]